MKRLSTATRLSLSLAALSVSVLLAAQSLGFVPEGHRPPGERPPDRGALVNFLTDPLVRLVLFTTGSGFVAHMFYLRRMLQYLEGTNVIPERVKSMLETLAEGVLVLDPAERIVLANGAFGALAGADPASLVGRLARDLRWTRADADADTDAQPATFPWTAVLTEGVTRKGEAVALRAAAAGRRRALTVNCAPITGVNGATRGALLTFDDVTLIEETNAQLRETLGELERSRDEIERQNHELHALATTDPLTGCLNRRSFYPELQGQWNTARRYGQSVAIVMVDVDHFKKINDKHGHTAGDQVLQSVSRILRSMARETDVVCRYGGEEFCVLLPQADVSAAARAAERYRAAIEAERCGAIAVTASFGVSALHLGARDAQEILDQADRALYVSKRGGRNRVVRWDEVSNTPEAIESAEAPRTAEPVRDDRTFSGPIAFHAVTALMSALSHRDRSTAEHSQRVADLVVTAARGRMGVRDCFILEIAAMLHDIGKLGVPDAVLRKPGPLNEAEWHIMRQHERMGVEILSAAFGSPALTEIVEHHHSWFAPATTCFTFPTGKNIPLGARLLSIADAYDAIVSNRPYRKGRAREDAFAELRKAAGAQFDPELVEQFIAAIGATADNERPDPVPMSEEKAVRLRFDLAKLACAAGTHDLPGVAEATRELAEATAGDDDGVSDRVACLREAVDQPADAEPDLQRILSITQELQELCRSSTGREGLEHAAQGEAGAVTPRR